jgi:hypothetical protein
VFDSTGVWIQGLAFARQALTWTMAPADLVLIMLNLRFPWDIEVGISC